ncbi:hypothetical protein BXZ70DRAFT_176169 [Cristinia sonorae]|uniref:F-box domain-containing protein n=1 Tax=Cristinia sonorae TaxID=1940300 RepID=A0A8K0UMS6_9AGAR|nr:hypothetical protein BXZ70DRAFT_176169 [Cristinia sonorae]
MTHYVKKEPNDIDLTRTTARKNHTSLRNDLKAILQNDTASAVKELSVLWPDRVQTYETVLTRARPEALTLLHGEKKLLDDLENQFVSAITRAKRNLAVRLSKLTFANMVPEDILCQIFRWAMLQTPGAEAGRTILCIAHTCVYWRNVAVKTPSLWTSLDLSSLTRTQAKLFAANSKLRPLYIRFSSERRQVPWTQTAQTSKKLQYSERLQFIKGVLRRSAALKLRLNRKVPSSLLDSKAPCLVEVDIECRSKVRPHHTHVLPDLFGSDTDNVIRSLTLSGVFVPWTCFSRSKFLTQLHLDFSNRRTSSNRPCAFGLMDEKILDVFLSCRSLRRLSLICQDALQGIPEPPCDPIFLPNLQSLRVEMRSSDAAFILRSLATPKDMSCLQILCTEEGLGHTLLPVHPKCLPCITGLTRLTVESHRISGFFSHSFSRLGDTAHFSLSFPSQDQGYPVDLAFGIILDDYCPMPQLTQVTIHVTDAQTEFYEDFLAFLRYCPTLVEVSIVGDDPIFVQKLAIHLPDDILPRCPEFTSIKLDQMKIPLPVLLKLAKTFFKNSSLRVALVDQIVLPRSQQERRSLCRRVGSRMRSISVSPSTTSIISNSKPADILWDVYEISDE